LYIGGILGNAALSNIAARSGGCLFIQNGANGADELTKTDMAKYLGSQSGVSEVLNRKRKLTLNMVKSLYIGLHIPAEDLLM
jgi:hypothetical protein